MSNTSRITVFLLSISLSACASLGAENRFPSSFSDSNETPRVPHICRGTYISPGTKHEFPYELTFFSSQEGTVSVSRQFLGRNLPVEIIENIGVDRFQRSGHRSNEFSWALSHYGVKSFSALEDPAEVYIIDRYVAKLSNGHEFEVYAFLDRDQNQLGGTYVGIAPAVRNLPEKRNPSLCFLNPKEDRGN